jgi:hypothetical protein
MNRESMIAEKVVSRIASRVFSLMQMAIDVNKMTKDLENDQEDIEQEVAEGNLHQGVLSYQKEALEAGSAFEKALRRLNAAVRSGK